jgi:DNA (cytosine-5)-methyltransferase 1
MSFSAFDTVDLFAGPGGWDYAATKLGLRVIGLEFDRSACATREAVGFETIEGDVTDYGPAKFPNATGLIASPPCPTFSAAGSGSGRRELSAVLNGIRQLADGIPVEHTWEDERTGLTLEPMRWVIEAIDIGKPYEWIALEQVPAVLPVWEAVAVELRTFGYSVATGILNAEQYGVPQTRRRAILIARLDGSATLPTPTHSKFYVKDRTRLDPGVKPWVSMAEALGWSEPFEYVARGQAEMSRVYPDSRPAPTLVANVGRNKWRMRSNYGTGGDPAKRGERETSEPSATVTSKIDRNKWTFEGPAPTVAGDPRLAPRGCKHPGPGCCSNYPGKPGIQFGPGSVRVSPAEAAVLQSFPADYPWQGNKGKVYQQIGNAIPPLLAEAVLRSALR